MKSDTAAQPPKTAPRADEPVALPAEREPESWTAKFGRLPLWLRLGFPLLLLLALVWVAYKMISHPAGAGHSASGASTADSPEMAARQTAHPVTYVMPGYAPAGTDLVLPATVQALQATSIYARTSGYVQRWLVDIGDHVKADQLLAELDTPEVDQDLIKAKADLEVAKANLGLAKVSNDRWQSLLASKSVSQQEADERMAAYKARESDRNAAQATVDRLEKLVAFNQIRAPFEGTITGRLVETGALVQAGVNGTGRELFRIAQTETVRLFIYVPQSYVRMIKEGIEADVMVDEFRNKVFEGKIARDAGALDDVSRTLLTEIHVPNPDGQLLPGMFARVKLKLQNPAPSMILPSNCVRMRAAGAEVIVVGPQNNALVKQVKIGRDFGPQTEIIDGLSVEDRVVQNPSDDLHEGVPLAPKQSVEPNTVEVKPGTKNAPSQGMH